MFFISLTLIFRISKQKKISLYLNHPIFLANKFLCTCWSDVKQWDNKWHLMYKNESYKSKLIPTSKQNIELKRLLLAVPSYDLRVIINASSFIFRFCADFLLENLSWSDTGALQKHDFAAQIYIFQNWFSIRFLGIEVMSLLLQVNVIGIRKWFISCMWRQRNIISNFDLP